jgi:hypothetical protein
MDSEEVNKKSKGQTKGKHIAGNDKREKGDKTRLGTKRCVVMQAVG